MVCKQYIVLNNVLSEKTASFHKPFPTRFPTAFPGAFPTTFPTDVLHILKISSKISCRVSCRISHKKCIAEANSYLIFTYDPPNQSF